MRRFATWQLYAACLFIWGTTWYVITLQVADTSPELGVGIRFAIASAFVFAICAVRGASLRFRGPQHLRLAMQGVMLYGVSYVCIYRAERLVVSGIVAVGFSLSPLTAGIGARIAFGSRIGPAFLLGGILSVAGVALICWHEITVGLQSGAATLGVVLTLFAVIVSSAGGLTASRNALAGMSLWPSLAWGMFYGAVTAFALAGLAGDGADLPSDRAWWLSLAYLAIAGSVVTFACFLTIQERRGPGAASTLGVMTPLLALLVSVVLEGYRPGAMAALGAALAIGGNVLMLRTRQQGSAVERSEAVRTRTPRP